MELAKILLKSLYLIALFMSIYSVAKSRVPYEGVSLYIFVFSVSALIMYFTFDAIYIFMMTNEISFNKINDDDSSKKNKISIKIRENNPPHDHKYLN